MAMMISWWSVTTLCHWWSQASEFDSRSPSTCGSWKLLPWERRWGPWRFCQDDRTWHMTQVLMNVKHVHIIIQYVSHSMCALGCKCSLNVQLWYLWGWRLQNMKPFVWPFWDLAVDPYLSLCMILFQWVLQKVSNIGPQNWSVLQSVDCFVPHLWTRVN